ncbi:MAG: glycosyltransferase family 9 protein [Acidaminococcaceae bacterium]
MKKIVVSRLDNIGDVVMTTPLLYQLKKMFPEAKLIFVVRTVAAPAVDRLPFIDEVIALPDKKTIGEQINVIKKIWHADFAYLMDYTHRIALLVYLARVRTSFGVAHRRAKLLTQPIEWEKEMDYIYDPVMFADLLKKSTGIDVMQEANWNTFHYSEATAGEKDRVARMFAETGYDIGKPYIVFSMYTSHTSKDWPEACWQELWSKIGEISDVNIVLTGDNSKNIKFGTNVIDLSGRTNLYELGYIIKKAKLVVNGCSAPMHIARAFKVPTIGLYGPTPAAKGAPPENIASFVTLAECAPCNGDYSSPCEKPFCMKLIKVDDVYKVIANFLAQLD